MRGWDWNHILIVFLHIALAFGLCMIIAAGVLEVVHA